MATPLPQDPGGARGPLRVLEPGASARAVRGIQYPRLVWGPTARREVAPAAVTAPSAPPSPAVEGPPALIYIYRERHLSGGATDFWAYLDYTKLAKMQEELNGKTTPLAGAPLNRKQRAELIDLGDRQADTEQPVEGAHQQRIQRRPECGRVEDA